MFLVSWCKNEGSMANKATLNIPEVRQKINLLKVLYLVNCLHQNYYKSNLIDHPLSLIQLKEKMG